LVLAIGADTQIALSVIESIAVDMVYHELFGAFPNQAMKTHGGDSIERLTATTALYYSPFKATKELIVLIIN
jgi:hypothetical protein